MSSYIHSNLHDDLFKFDSVEDDCKDKFEAIEDVQSSLEIQEDVDDEVVSVHDADELLLLVLILI